MNKELFTIERKLDSFRIPVKEGPHEIKERMRTFPAHLQAKKAGESIHIENADGFIEWLSKDRICMRVTRKSSLVEA